MSTTYKVRSGDTFELISGQVYGVPTGADRIISANPGASNPPVVGTTLTIPADPSALVPLQASANGPSEIAVLIDGKRFRYWQQVSLTLTLDSIATAAFAGPFDPDAPGYREAFAPLSFKPVQVTVGGQPVFTGTMVSIIPTVDESKRVFEAEAYALPGVLDDCTASSSSYPVEWYNDETLQVVTDALLAPFGIKAVFDGPTTSITGQDGAAIGIGEKVLAFLVKHAKKQKLVVSSTAAGELRFFSPVSGGVPVARLFEYTSPVISVTSKFNPQSYYSHITGIEAALMGWESPPVPVANPHLKGAVRPFTFKIKEGDTDRIQEAVEAKMGRMFANVASYRVEVDTWRTPAGDLWSPGDVVQLTAPGAMVYEAYDFAIRSVTFKRDEKSEKAVLNLIIPGTLAGEIPEVLPWAT